MIETEVLKVPTMLIANCDNVINAQENNDTIINLNSINNVEQKSENHIESNQPECITAEVTEEKSNEKWCKFNYDWKNTPQLLCSAVEEYKPNEQKENITRGCQWSPDGTCLLVPAADFRIRIYELPRELYSGEIPNVLPLSSLTPVLKIKEGGLVYDACWYPHMCSWDPATCYFLNTSKETPIHLWDAFTGELRATYRAYNQVDEVEAAISVQFTDSGNTIWSGFKNFLRFFDTNRPGRQVTEVSLKNDFPNVHGIVSCIRENPMAPGLVAFGTYSKCIGLYKDGPLCSFKTGSGVTQIEFSPCGTKLYSAVRRNSEFLCWDLRNPGIVLNSFNKREADTNQRIQFSLSHNGDEIISGGTDGIIKIWKTSETDESVDIDPAWRICLSSNCINGVNMHKKLPILATCSGQRIYDDETVDCQDNSVRLWYCDSKK